MSSANIKHFAHDLLRRWGSWLTALGAARRCAVRLDCISERLGAMGERINQLRERMEGDIDEPIDEDWSLRASLKALKEDIRGIRCQLSGMDTPHLSARLKRAFSRLGKVAEETYAGADKLQWEIDEHDARFGA